MWMHVLRNALIPIITNVMALSARRCCVGSFLIERFFSIPGHRPRGHPGRRAQRLPGDQGDHRLRRDRHHARQPAGRPAVQGGRPAGAAQVRAAMATTSRDAARRRAPRESRTRSPGLWALAWRRLRRDRVGMVSLAIVVAFFADDARCPALGLVAQRLVDGDGRHLRAADVPRRRRRGRHAGAPAAQPGRSPRTPRTSRSDRRCHRRARDAATAGARPAARSRPLADVMTDITLDAPLRRGASTRRCAADTAPRRPADGRERAATLPFGGDKWGRDVLAEDDQGLGDVDLRRPRRGAARDASSAPCSARSPATTAAGSTTSSTGSTTSSPRSPTCC